MDKLRNKNVDGKTPVFNLKIIITDTVNGISEKFQKSSTNDGTP
jgi:hypothetical protein